MTDTQPKHTPGPWRPNGNTIELANGMALRVATCTPIGTGYASKGREESRANARLIAAAPDMLDALRGLLADPYLADPINADRMAKARAAIAKATAT